MTIGSAIMAGIIGLFVIASLIAWLLTPQEKPPGAQIHLEGP